MPPRTKAPCKDCPDRFPACHGQCEPYKEWKDNYLAGKAKARRGGDALGVIITAIDRAKREQHRRQGK